MTSSTPTRRTAAWRSFTATSPSAAAWSRRPGRRIDPQVQRAGLRGRIPGRRGRRDPQRPGQVRRRGRDPLRRPAWRSGMQEMLYPTSYLKGLGLERNVPCSPTAFLRWHLRPFDRPRLPEAAAGGAIALVETGDEIAIDIPTGPSRSRSRRKPWPPDAKRSRAPAATSRSTVIAKFHRPCGPTR